MNMPLIQLNVSMSQPGAIPPLANRIQPAMRRQGAGHSPAWNTETGWLIENADGTSVGKVPDYWLRGCAEQSAAFVARWLLSGNASGVECFFWYAWDNITSGLIEPGTKALKRGGVALGVFARGTTGSPSLEPSERAGRRMDVLDSSSSTRVDGLPRLFLLAPSKQGGWR